MRSWTKFVSILCDFFLGKGIFIQENVNVKSRQSDKFSQLLELSTKQIGRHNCLLCRSQCFNVAFHNTFHPCCLLNNKGQIMQVQVYTVSIKANTAHIEYMNLNCSGINKADPSKRKWIEMN